MTCASVGIVVISDESTANTCYAIEWFQLFACETNCGIAITFNFLIVNTFVVLKFLMQSYDALEQETTKSRFFDTVICGGYMLFVTNKPPFAITVAATIYLSLIFAYQW